jgi:RHS repeat-associated protein
VRWMLSDHQGTVRDVTNNSGVIQKHLRYDSFGIITSQTSPAISTRFNYTGRELEAETGLYFYRARYYDPGVGRFLSEDAIGFQGGDVNLYRYVGNNPVNAVDPLGYKGVPARPPITRPVPRRFPTVAPPTGIPNRPPSLTIPCISAPRSPCIPKQIPLPPPQPLDPDYWLTDPSSPLRIKPISPLSPFLNPPKAKSCPPQSQRKKRCELIGEFLANIPNTIFKTCAYDCRGYAAPATFPWPKDLPCPDSFDGNFPPIPNGYPDPNTTR